MELSDEEMQLVLQHRESKKPKWYPKIDHNMDEKIQAFNQLHEMALNHYRETLIDGSIETEIKQWAFEAVMELLGKDVWKSYNAACR